MQVNYNRHMDERAFIEQKQASWQELSETIEHVRKLGLHSLSREQLKTFGMRYRTVVSDLAFVRTQGASENLVAYLNELAGRAHGVLYVSRRSGFRGLVTFLLHDYPCLFRSVFRFPLFATVLFMVGLGIGVYVMVTSPNTAQQWVPPQIADPAGASSYIMTNNMKVGILSFATGITAGLLTAYLIVSNGVMLGAVAAGLPAAKRMALYTFVAPHGVIELVAIFICGGAGFMIGSAMIAPGNMRRVDAMKLASGKAIKLFAGTLPMFVVAGIIEGFVSPSSLPAVAKFVFSGVTALGLVLYLGFGGRESRQSAVDSLKSQNMRSRPSMSSRT